MAYDVSSYFTSNARSKSPNVKRLFKIQTSDYSSRVMSWPKFKRTWDDIRPKSLSIKLANGDKGMNFIREDKTLMQNDCYVEMGFGSDTIILFSGKMQEVKYSREVCTLVITDKFQQLSDRSMGLSDSPVQYVSSNYLPSDIAWWAVTSYGGFSTITNSSNPDIDYEAFTAWASVFSGDSVFVNATFNGQKVTEVLRKIARNTHSAIFIKEDKISFHRFGIADSSVSSLGADQLINMDLSFNLNSIVNRQFVSGDYDVNSKYHKFTVVEEDSTSVNSFGIKDNIIKDNNIWYVDSASALNFAQRRILANSSPDDSMLATSGLAGIPRLIGETLIIEDSFHGITESYRILSHQINVDNGRTSFTADRTQLTNPFILDTSSLDNTVEVLT